MKDTIEITEHVDAANPGMVTVTIDVDARVAEVTHTMPAVPYTTGTRWPEAPKSPPRVVLTMTLPREACPLALGAARPFDGWKIRPWQGDNLWADLRGGKTAIVGMIHESGWVAWEPLMSDAVGRGPETGQAGRDTVIAALRSKGAKL